MAKRKNRNRKKMNKQMAKPRVRIKDTANGLYTRWFNYLMGCGLSYAERQTKAMRLANLKVPVYV